MITLNQKQQIILKFYREGKSQREIFRETGIARETIRRYTRLYEQKLKELSVLKDEDNIKKVDLITDIVEAPKYTSSGRKKRVLTDEIKDRIEYFLDENKEKIAKGMRKQQKRKIDIYDALISEGYSISYSTVQRTINSLSRKGREAYIKQVYNKGDVCEFDWGTVKLYISGSLKTFQMAVFTSAYGNYRYAILFPKQNTNSFQEAHALFFDKINGVYQTLVYDNMRVAIKRFVGRNVKEPTEGLLKLSLYYKFKFRFCNIRSGNEKGHVEKSVDVVRRKAFSHKDQFESLEEANAYLEMICEELNTALKYSNKGITAAQLLEEEKEYLLPQMPKFETAETRDLRVDKYSTIIVDSCHYSVPDSYVSCLIRTKIYSNKIICYYNNERIAVHTKKHGYNEWSFNIEHYLKTLSRKPGALANSVAVMQMNSTLYEIYMKYFSNKPKEFIDLIHLVKNKSLKEVEDAIDILLSINPNDITLEKIKFICNREEPDIVAKIDDNSEIVIYSQNILKSYSELLINSKGGISSNEVRC
ncbi:IS21 family transposase [Clostridium sediminicola]|uniref:IS21 family transposase n=1 Tax=Clostridium sediminicola TaxID=3114879 RepID=UPI0031F27685